VLDADAVARLTSALAISRARAVRVFAACVGLALLLGGSLYAYWVCVDHRLTIVTPEQVFQSAEMPPEDLVRVSERLGVQTVFDFRADADQGSGIASERAALERNGIRYIHLPSSRTPAPETVAAFVRAMQAEVAAHRRVLLHCHDGEGRAVFYAAIYRIQFEGWDNQRAYLATTRLPPALMFLTKAFPAIGRLSPTNPKTQLILSYTPRIRPELAEAAGH
jgi:protein tyrosine phosphatase (PTP) superfamily phosphohydrolase (DUF442 family)